MRGDVDRWALERRDELATLFRKQGALPKGAMVLVTRDPRTRAELEAPETLEQSSVDYESYADFVQALRTHCLRCAGLGVVLFGEGMVYPEATPAAENGYPVVVVSFACRGRVQAKLWTARVVESGETRELEGFVESVDPQRGKDRIFPIMN